ncbi:hypothetical protein [Streptomyces sp. NPDC002265]|uniref:hypothetical protein n=1 Tax=Streptomyces sp. NPDC002265 TaxID=3154415 RepID=UPI003328C0A7
MAKSRTVCCCGTELPSRSHTIAPRASVSILSSCAGPQVTCSTAPLFRAWTLRDMATHSFHTHRQRAHSASNRASAVDDTRRR